MRHFPFALVASFFAAFASIFALNAITVSTGLLSVFLLATLPEMSKATSLFLIAELTLMPTIPIWLKFVSLKRLLNLASAGFIISSLIAYSVVDIEGFVIARVFQGAFSGLLLPLPYLFIKSEIAKELQTKAITMFTSLTVTAPILGPLVALSLPPNHISWVFVFIALLAVPCLFVQSEQQSKSLSKIETGNTIGFLFLCTGISIFVWAIEHFQLWGGYSNFKFRTFITIGVGFVLIGIISQYGYKKPLFNIKLFKIIDSAFILIMSMLMGVVVYGLLYLVPYYLVLVHGAEPSTIFKVVLYAAIPQIVLLPCIIWLRDRCSAYLLIGISFIILAIMSIVLSQIGFDFGPEQMLLPQLLRAVGISLLVLPMSLAMLNSAPKELHEDMSTLYSFFRTLGGAFSIAGMSAYINYRANSYLLDNKAYGHFNQNLKELSYVYAFNDAFGYLSYGLIFCSLLSFLLWFKSLNKFKRPLFSLVKQAKSIHN